MNPGPFKLINCLAQGYAVAGSPENPEDDFEMVWWGLPRDQALDLRDKLNREMAQVSSQRPPLHVRD